MLLSNVMLAGIVYFVPMIFKCVNESNRKSAIKWFIIEATFYIVMVALPFLANMFNEAHGFGQDRVYVLAFMGTASTLVLMYRIWMPFLLTQTKERQQQEDVAEETETDETGKPSEE